jgi:hypothetical protein
MNRRSEKLDKFLGKKVEITFTDGDVEQGWLEFDRPYWGLKFGSNRYSLEGCYANGTCSHLFFRKSHVKSIKEVR